jgi:GPH family glycoside/pentoside/hexuronide:cation symporter
LLESLRDRALRPVMVALFAICLAQTVRGSLFHFFVSRFMGVPQLTGLLFLLQLCFALLAPMLWLRVARRLGKRRAVVVAELAQAAINLGLLLVHPGGLPLLLALTMLQGLAQSSGNVLLRALVGDLASDHRRATGVDRLGAFFAAFSLSGKLAVALAMGTALPLMALAGFAPVEGSTGRGQDVLWLTFALGPAIFHATAALIIAGSGQSTDVAAGLGELKIARVPRSLSD